MVGSAYNKSSRVTLPFEGFQVEKELALDPRKHLVKDNIRRLSMTELDELKIRYPEMN